MQETRFYGPQRLTLPNVKVRRLGYIAAIAEILVNKEMPKDSLLARIMDFASENAGYLEEYTRKLPIKRRKRTKVVGAVETRHAAMKYLATAQEMGFVIRLNNSFSNTKMGEVLAALPSKKNSFSLSISRRHLIMRVLLQTDLDYFWALFRTLKLAPMKGEWKVFREQVIKCWETKMPHTLDLKQEYDMLRASMKSINSWSSPERYYRENIRATRLEWFADLGLIRYWIQKSDTVRFIEGAGSLFPRPPLSRRWLDGWYTQHFARLLTGEKVLKSWDSFNTEERMSKLHILLEETMDCFKTFSDLYKISADQFLEYSSSKVAGEGIVAPTSSIMADLERFTAMRSFPYSLTRMVSEADSGYIMRSR